MTTKSGFFAEIYEQPAALYRLIDTLPAELTTIAPFVDKLRRGDFTTVIFTGMGSSLSACVPATIILAQYGIAALVIEASELVAAYRPLLGPKTLVVAVSQSGYSAEIVRLVNELDHSVTLIGVTNTPDSPLAKHSAATLLMQAGAELTVSTKSYTCSLALLHLLALTLVGQPIESDGKKIRQLADQLTDLLPGFEQQAAEIVNQIAPVSFIEYLGRGASRASAITAALITKETAKMPTEGMAGGQFRHGPWELLGPDITVCLFSGSSSALKLDLVLAADIVARGGKAILVGSEALPGAIHVQIPTVSPLLAPILEIIPVQFLASELAKARGFTPGTFRYSGKITTTE